MSIVGIEGVVFDNQRVSSSDHASIFQSILDDGIVSGCELSFSGSNIYVNPGYIIGAGREVHITDKITIVTSTANKYIRLVGNIDLSKESTETDFSQFSFSYDATTALENFVELTKNSINSGSGTIYQFEIAVFEVQSNVITSIVRQIGPVRAKVSEYTITISASSWEKNQASVPCSAVHSNNHPFVTFAPTSFLTWRDCGVFCAGFGEGTVSFGCITKPTTDVTAIVRL